MGLLEQLQQDPDNPRFSGLLAKNIQEFANDPINVGAQRLSNSYPVINQDPRQASLNELLQFGGIGSIRTVHGSPHKFTKFSDSASGTGEGFNAFGKGHYSGKNAKALDSHYRKRLSQDSDFLSLADKDTVNWIGHNPKDYQKLINHYKQTNKGSGNFFSINETNRYLTDAFYKKRIGTYDNFKPYLFKDDSLNNIIDNAVKNIEPRKINKGYLYLNELKPDEKDLLHFNKALKDHPEPIRNKLQSLENIKGMGILNSSYGKAKSGKDLFERLEHIHGQNAVKKVLTDAGIPGHSFLGQGGKGLSNYVIYDPNDIKILRRIYAGLDNPSNEKRNAIMKGLLDE